MRTLPLIEVQAHLAALISNVENEHERITVTRNGVPSAVVLSADESLQETLAVLSDQQAIADLQESADNIAEGELCDTDEVLEELEQRRSSPRV